MTPLSAPSRRLPNPLAVLLLLAGATGCVPSLHSDSEVVNVSFPGAHDIENRLVVPGAVLCPRDLTDIATDASVEACYTLGGDPSVWNDTNGCLTPVVAGSVALVLTGVPCTIAGVDFTAVDDTLTLEALGAADVYASIQWLEEQAQVPDLGLVEPIPSDTYPADGAPLRVASGGSMLLTPELRRVADGLLVGWSDGQLSATVEGSSVVVTTPLDDDGVGGTVQIDVAAGADAVVRIGMDGAGTWPLTPVVADAGPYTIDTVYVAVIAGDDGMSQPLGARAVVRNAAGDIVFGAPVTWSSDLLPVTTGIAAGLPSSDYASVSDECRDPNTVSGEQHATVTATLDGQAVSAELVWTPAPGDGSTWNPPEGCGIDVDEEKETPACGCAAVGGPGGPGVALGALLAALLGAMVRRR